MNGFETIAAAAGAYAIAGALITMLPGPDTAVVLATAIDGGRRAAVRAALGISVGLLFWAAAASVGLAGILRASTEVYTVFRVVAVGYLLWLAFRAVRSAVRGQTEGGVTPVASARRFTVPWGFRRALLTAVLNPKLGVFFVVFLPQFVPARVSSSGVTLLFGAIQACEALVWYLALGALASAARALLTRPVVRRVLDGITAALFTFFGARLAFDA